MPAWLLALRASFTFLTRIPVGGFPYPSDTWKWISIWFPFVGLVLGLFASLVFLLLSDTLSYLTLATIIVGLGLLITGGFHEDGLADTADALGGAYDRDRVMTILKDSRIGAFGGMALVIVIVLRVSLLSDLADNMVWGLILGQSLSRANSTMQLAIFPYAQQKDGSSKSKDVAVSGRIQFSIAFMWTIGIVSGAMYFGLPTETVGGILVAMTVILLYLGWRFMSRAGGLTGDFLGTTQQLTEIAILLVLAAQ